jgi:MOSC domain-containing protein YiiM
MVTGICKYPVEGPVRLTREGIPADAIVATEHHGGVDQAVYAYSADDYDWWSQHTGRNMSPGLFGENLTIRDMPSDMRIGDRLLIGEVVLEATAPRIPCDTFAARMQDSGFGMAFRKAERPGIYFRVLNEGEVSAGDAVTFVENDDSDVTVLDLFHFYYALRHEADMLRRLLDAPLAERFRHKVETKLAALA